MRFLIQRVKKAEVTIQEQTVAKIGKGLLIFVGLEEKDFSWTESQFKKMIEKTLYLRIFSDKQNKLNLNVQEIGGEILLVSQFTLYADCRKGRRPSFSKALGGEQAQELFARLIQYFKCEYPEVKTGVFGAEMDISLINHGPVTIWLDSKELGIG